MNYYKSWEFCKKIRCYALGFNKEHRVQMICHWCKAYQMHQYLKFNGQILETEEEDNDG